MARSRRSRARASARCRSHRCCAITWTPLDGQLGEPNWIARTNVRAARIWAAADLPSITLHEARHTYASLMIAAGVNAKALSTFMGHAAIAVTLDLYGHLFPGSEDEAATLLDSYLAREIGASTQRFPLEAHEEIAI
jgi:hypothetical protein